jgi:hypothetical protein
MNQILLAAGLLGVGMAEALKKLVSQQARRKAIPFVVGGILVGAGVCYYINYALLKSGTPGLSEILGVLVVLIAVIVRFRQ